MAALGYSDSDELELALSEIRRIEEELIAAGDRPTLDRFGSVEAGMELASKLGFTLLASAEARVVDQLGYLPDAVRLIRSYLRAVGVSRANEAGTPEFVVEAGGASDRQREPLPQAEPRSRNVISLGPTLVRAPQAQVAKNNGARPQTGTKRGRSPNLTQRLPTDSELTRVRR